MKRVHRLRAAARASLWGCAICVSAPSIALAIDFESESGEFFGSWDTTLTYGQATRVQSPDDDLIATSAGGNSRGPNDDNGTQNFATGTYSQLVKLTTEAELNYKQFGAFVRAFGFYDHEIEDEDRERTPLGDAALDLVGSRAELLDAYVWGRFDLGTMPGEVRVGEQVLSWGESTFIQNGINVINHIDVSALRVPGAELREGLLPQGLVSFSLGTTENTSIEAFYQYEWDDTEPEPVGSYFSSNDFAPDGGEVVTLGFGAVSDLGTDFSALGGGFFPDFRQVGREPTRYPDDGGQYGLAFRVFAPDFSNGTDFGFYFINYHSRLPLINGRTGTQAGIGNAAGAATAVGGAAQGLAAGLTFNSAVAAAAQAAVGTAASLGGDLSLGAATERATIGANAALAGGDVAGIAGAFAQHEFAQTAGYFTEFPEDIQLYGFSFNTQLGTSGIALQGEVSYRDDVPLQFDDVEVLFAALSPLDSAIGSGDLAEFGQLGGFGTNQVVVGYDRFNVYQAQATATKVFGPVFGANQGALVAESAITHVQDFPEQNLGGPNGQGLRFNGPGTPVSGNLPLADLHFGEVEPVDRFATRSSWGYRIAGRLDYFNGVGPWTVSPRFSFQHDVNGTSPGPGGNFIEDLKAITVGVNGNLQNRFSLDLSYTEFYGAGRYNLINDRDFIAFSAQYSF
ncbi:MAG: DUF1302 domain-containing protein [Gammaproteobacteria bacterium]|nr:DUF1302 domain-containing protein [Gammaproteobacteria bacterium]